mmetsp:Transcript_24326/g.67334  ORF Transcript_24326/g.67334 Transcript_24326/m.67334 type:complete len:820 (-) Transcript_24326:159-2618(-)
MNPHNNTMNGNSGTSNPSGSLRNANYGAPVAAPTKGNFPAVGSTLGPYFSVGRLGFGTFCSIHKCINLDYNHRKTKYKRSNRCRAKDKKKALRLVAAKVEIGEFKNSGVLGGEASILHFLDDVLPPHSVPTYMGHYVSTDRDRYNKNVTSAIVMEYLTGQDMHKIREWSNRHQFKIQQQQQQEQKLQKEQQEPQFSPQHYSDDHNNMGNEDVRMNSLSSSKGSSKDSDARPRRRIAVNDAVYLTAHVMLPLLRKMHSVGIIHRDVKPSNVVKRSDSTENLFCMVDFGLSKSIVVPHNSELANPKQSWKGSTWMGDLPGSSGPRFELLSPDRAANASACDNNKNAYAQKPCYRVERRTADFRGTSMYASVRVHQLREYSPRDDIWSLLYVFCDLASGGLPWMCYAANRDRAACKLLKERIHGLEAQADGRIKNDTRRLLMGDEYHRALFKKRNGKVDPPMDHEEGALIEDDVDPDLPPPLALSEDEHKVEMLTRAFDHLKGLWYADIPDYDLIQKCLESFLEKEIDPRSGANTTAATTKTNGGAESFIPRIDWKLLSESFKCSDADGRSAKHSNKRSSVPTWELAGDDMDPLDASIFAEAETSISKGNNGEEESAPLYGEAADMARLPLEMRFRIAQMEYNASHNSTIEPHLALNDWLAACLPLLHGSWNSRKYEKGGHRSNDDGYRRELFLKIVNKCLDCASRFGWFRDVRVMYDDNDDESDDESEGTTNKTKESGTDANTERPSKRRRRRRNICTSNSHEPTAIAASGEERPSETEGNGAGAVVDLVLISRVLFELRMTKKAEEKLSPPPPIRLSFGS